MAWVTLPAFLELPCDGYPVGQALFPDQAGVSAEFPPAPPAGFADTQQPLLQARLLNGRPSAVGSISGSSRAELPTGPLGLGD